MPVGETMIKYMVVDEDGFKDIVAESDIAGRPVITQGEYTTQFMFRVVDEDGTRAFVGEHELGNRTAYARVVQHYLDGEWVLSNSTFRVQEAQKPGDPVEVVPLPLPESDLP